MEFDKEALESWAYQAPTLSSLEDKRKQTIDNLLKKVYHTQHQSESDKVVTDSSHTLENTINHIIHKVWTDRTPWHQKHFQEHYTAFLKKVWSCKDPEVLKQMYSIFIAVKEQRPLNQDQVDLLVSFGLKNRESVKLINDQQNNIWPHTGMWFWSLNDVTFNQLFLKNYIINVVNVTYSEDVGNNLFLEIYDTTFWWEFSLNDVSTACCANMFKNFTYNTIKCKNLCDNIFTWGVYNNTFEMNTAEEIRKNNTWDDALDAYGNKLTFKTFKERNTFLNMTWSEPNIKNSDNNKVESFPNLSW